jgi:hypothetical protein
MLRAATGANLAGKSHAMKLRAALLIACTSLAMSIAGCLPVLAATRHVVLLFDEVSNCQVCRSWMQNWSTHFGPTPPSRSKSIAIVMDLSRSGSNAYKALLRDFFRTKYADKKIDVAVAVMAPAFDFWSAYGELIFPGTPIVFCGLGRTQLATRSLPSNVYGVLVEREFAHPRQEAEGCVRTVFHHQGGRDGHGALGFPLREPLWKRTTGRYPRLTRPKPALCSGSYCLSLATQLLPLNGRSADRDAQRRHIHGSVFT